MKGCSGMRLVFLDAETVGNDIDISCFSKFGDFVSYPMTQSEEVVDRIKDADIIITNKIKLTAEVLSNAKNLKLVCVTATGFDNVDVEYAKANKIGVCNVKGYSTDSVAQITVSAVMYLAAHLNSYNYYTKSGEYTNSGVPNKLVPVFHELAGKTWGVYGFGDIGKKVAHIAKAIGCKILVCKKNPVDDFECVSLDELFERCDIITVHTPLTPETRHSINENVLSKAKKNLILFNAARGAVTDESAVAKAVETGIIDSFGTDVYSTEPLQKDSPLYRIKDRSNVLLTPHMAWGAYEARERLISEICENIKAFFDGAIRNRVDI